jgi:hypothetical protein
MGIGHLGVGLALKRVDPKINLGLLFFVVLSSDFLLGILVLLGVEQVVIPDNYEELHYLYYVFPYSHGLAATILWSAFIFLLIKLFWPKGKGNSTIVAGILAIAAFSHFLLDLLVHIPEIPLLGQNSYKMGLGLWDYLEAALAVEGLLVIGGLTLYLKYTSGSGFAAKYGMILLIGLLLIGQALGQIFAPAPADVTGIAITLIVQFIIFVGLAFWLDGKRVGRSA